MTATNLPQSVLEKALALKAEASRLRDGEVADQQARQISQRVQELDIQLEDLDALLRTIQKLRRLDSTVPLDVPSLGDAYAGFARRAATGLPDNNAFSAAKKRLRRDITQLRDTLSAVWSTWAGRHVEALPHLRITLLAAERRKTERDRFRELGKLARISVPTLSDVTLFATVLRSLSDTLADLDDPSEDLVSLVERLSERAVTLDDISDDQIALLRRSGLAGEIQLNRRGV